MNCNENNLCLFDKLAKSIIATKKYRQLVLRVLRADRPMARQAMRVKDKYYEWTGE